MNIMIQILSFVIISRILKITDLKKNLNLKNISFKLMGLFTSYSLMY